MNQATARSTPLKFQPGASGAMVFKGSLFALLIFQHQGCGTGVLFKCYEKVNGFAESKKSDSDRSPIQDRHQTQ